MTYSELLCPSFSGSFSASGVWWETFHVLCLGICTVIRVWKYQLTAKGVFCNDIPTTSELLD